MDCDYKALALRECAKKNSALWEIDKLKLEIATLRAEIEKLKAERDEAREWGVQREFELSARLASAHESERAQKTNCPETPDSSIGNSGEG